MLVSEVLLGRARWIPNPGVAVSLCSGRISPKRRPAWRGGAVLEFGGSGPAPDESCVVDLDAFSGPETAARGLDILLANDCALLEAWSAVAYFERCEPRVPDPLPASGPVFRAAVVFGAPYEVVPLPTPSPLPPTLSKVVSRGDVDALGIVLGTTFRTGEECCEADWSNFFLRSFTLGGTLPLVFCPVPPVSGVLHE